MEFTAAMIGKPFMWRTAAYGNIAVHITKFSTNGAVAVLSIDGGEDATPAHRFPELSDGIGYAVAGQLHKPSRRGAARIGATSTRKVPAQDPVPAEITKSRRAVAERALRAAIAPLDGKEITF